MIQGQGVDLIENFTTITKVGFVFAFNTRQGLKDYKGHKVEFIISAIESTMI